MELERRTLKNGSGGINEHNYGIDLLRIVSMIMIPIIHVLLHGGILDRLKPLSANYEVAWLLELASACAVDVFALISGYVGYGRRHRYSGIINMYFQVAFYTVITTVAFLAFKPETVGLKTLVKAVFPFAYDTYWYFSAYFCLFFFMPFFDRAIAYFARISAKLRTATAFCGWRLFILRARI